MRIGCVIHILGFLLMFLAGAMLVPIGFSLFYGDSDYAALFVSSGITLLVGFAAFKATKFDRDLRPKEGFAVVTFGWVFFSLFGSLPFILSGVIPSFTDAFFETMSGFTTTGATILEDIGRLEHGVLFWRHLTHWIGGMGIIVLSLAILPFLGIGGMQMFNAESPGPVADKLTPTIAQTAKVLWGVYVLISGVEVLLLILGGMNLFEAMCHTFATMATGGFSTRNASIGAFDSGYIEWVIIFFMMAAGTNFALHYQFLRRDFRSYVRNREFLLFLAIIGIATVLIGIDTVTDRSREFPLAFRATVFQVVSILTTTGFVTADYEEWAFSSQFVLLVLMFLGGCAGSTGGAMKIMRIYVLGKFIFSEITRILHPRAVVAIRIGSAIVPREVVANIVGFSILYIVIFCAGVLILAALGLDMNTSFGAAAAALGNIGPGLGAVGPTDHYKHIPMPAKWTLSLLMLMGRLELFTVIVLFSPSYWKK